MQMIAVIGLARFSILVMKQTFQTLLLLLALVGIASRVHAKNAPRCEGNSAVGGECFVVHGRLSVWNGNPTFRIWPVGTRRMLGVRNEFELPSELDPYLGYFDDVVYADFKVCPLTPPKEGVMQIVCVESAANIKKTTRQP